MLSFLKPGIGAESNLKNTGVKDGKKGLKFKIKLTIFFFLLQYIEERKLTKLIHEPILT